MIRFDQFGILTCMEEEIKEGNICKVIDGVHSGKLGIVRDINISKTGAITITVVQENGERFKTLAKSVEIVG